MSGERKVFHEWEFVFYEKSIGVGGMPVVLLLQRPPRIEDADVIGEWLEKAHKIGREEKQSEIRAAYQRFMKQIF